MNKIDITKTYATRGGLPVRIYAMDGAGPYPIHGAVRTERGWEDEKWDKYGEYVRAGASDFDLIPVKTWRAWKEGEAPRFFMAKHKESAVCSIQLASRDGSNTSSYYFHLFNNYDRLHEDGTTTPCGVLDG